jgi:GWxTD domain-containing protein
MAIVLNPGTFAKPCYFHTRMKYLSICLLLSINTYGQPLRDINYNFLYNPVESFEFSIEAIKSTEGWTAFYELELRDTTHDIDQFTIQWDLRPDLSEKEGVAVSEGGVTLNATLDAIHGSVHIDTSTEPRYLTAKVVNRAVKRAWVFSELLQPDHPANGYVMSGNRPILDPYITVDEEVTLLGEGEQKVISYYNDNFPAAVPGFSTGVARVAKAMAVDSAFKHNLSDPITFSKTGLYLVQTDTNSTEGFAFRVEDDYPRLARIESLADPLIYVCTKQEFERIKQAKGDKKAFDRVILSITQNQERARNFMRSYFRRVELANQYFTSYKEGWKTDRGMIYIIFGLPDQVYKFTDREVWSYKNAMYKITFDFVRSGTLFDPENFVLVREKKFQETWYEVIDLWRNARF